MNVFIVCLEAVLPIFILLLIGYGARRVGLMEERDVRRINAVNYKTFMPVMLFESIYSSELEKAINPGLIAYSVIGVLAMIAISFVFVMLVEKENSKRGVMIQALYRSNFALVGIPVAEALMRGGDISVVAVQLAVIVPIFNVAAVLILEGFSGKKADIRQTLKNVAKNPLIISSLLGILFLYMDWDLPYVAAAVVEDMAGVAGPLALFTLGSFFRFDTLGKYTRELFIVCTGRLIVIPAIFLFIGYWLGFRGADFAGLMGLFSSCAAIASFIMTEQIGGNSELAGDIVVATSFLCSFTLYLWAVLFMSLGAF